MKKPILVMAFALIAILSNAQIDSAQMLIDNIEAGLKYEEGQIQLAN